MRHGSDSVLTHLLIFMTFLHHMCDTWWTCVIRHESVHMNSYVLHINSYVLHMFLYVLCNYTCCTCVLTHLRHSIGNVCQNTCNTYVNICFTYIYICKTCVLTYVRHLSDICHDTGRKYPLAANWSCSSWNKVNYAWYMDMYHGTSQL